MIDGKDIITLVQPVNASDGGLVVANLTENTHTIENELIDEQTKFGRVLGYGQTSESMEITCYGDENDPGQKAIIDAIRNKERIKIWEVNRIPNDDGTYDAVFAYGFVESVEKSSAQDGFMEISATVQIEKQSQEGTLTSLPPEAFPDGASYDFEEPVDESTGS